jgi:hypothetical protein
MLSSRPDAAIGKILVVLVVIVLVVAATVASLAVNSFLRTVVTPSSKTETVTTATDYTVTQTTTETTYQYPTSGYSINRSLGLELELHLNATTIVDSLPNSTALNVSLSEYYILQQPTNVSTGGDSPLQTLGEVFPCAAVPFGIGVYSGYYTANNISNAKAFNLYGDILECGANPLKTPSHYLFESSNLSTPITSNIPIDGYCCSNIIYQEYHSASSEIPFPAGTYTLAAGDPWGNLVILHFTVVASAHPSNISMGQNLTHVISVVNNTAYTDCRNCGTNYIFEIEASYSGNENWTINPLNFLLMTNTHSVVYQAITVNNLNLPKLVTLGPNTHATENIAFVVPVGQSPLALEYNVSLESLYLSSSIPAVTAGIFVIPSSVAFVGTQTNETSQGLQATIQNLNFSGVFCSGQKEVFLLSIVNFRQNGNVTIDLISVTGSLEILSVTPATPVELGSKPITFAITITAPYVLGYLGQVNLTITFT